MKNFIEKHKEKIVGTLSGFDRLVLRGTIRRIAYVEGMMGFLNKANVLLKDFSDYVQQKTACVKAASLEEAQQQGRPVRYLESAGERKEDIARRIARQDGVKEGLVCVLTCVEPCRTFDIHRNRAQRKLELVMRTRKCLYIYHYFIDPVFGFMNARIQTWFPFNIQICLNGREWLARQMDANGIDYKRSDNCFPWISDLGAASKLMASQLGIRWPYHLDRIARRLNPALAGMFGGIALDYYWTVYQSEWATDVMFKSRASLAGIYGSLTRGAVAAFSCADVLRFLGRKFTGHYEGELLTSYAKRVEGLRLKHRAGGNTIKLYDKFGIVLRTETTINVPYDFKVYRAVEGDSGSRKDWRVMRKGVADLKRRADVSQASNERYLDSLAAVGADIPLAAIVAPVCRPVTWNGNRVRALRPWEREDQALLQAVCRGEFSVNGFRNRDLVSLLFAPSELASPEHKRRCSARVTRKLRMLRAHGLIKKVSGTHRYVLTDKGRRIITAVIEYQNISLEQIYNTAA